MNKSQSLQDQRSFRCDVFVKWFCREICSLSLKRSLIFTSLALSWETLSGWEDLLLLACDSLSSSLAVVALIYNEDQVLSYVNVTLACDDVYGKWLTNCFVWIQLTFYLKYIISLDWKFTRPITSVVSEALTFLRKPFELKFCKFSQYG